MTLKKLHNLFILALTVLVASCSSDDVVTVNGGDEGQGTVAVFPALKTEDSRSALAFNGTGMKFEWSADDVLRIYPKYSEKADQGFSGPAYAPGTLLTLLDGKTRVNSDGSVTGEFGLNGKSVILNAVNTSTYLTFFPGRIATSPGYEEIEVSYLNQRQETNVQMGKYGVDDEAYLASEKAASAHLSDYLFMHGEAEQTSSGFTSFDMYHLGATVRFFMKIPDADNPQVFDSLIIYHKYVSDEPIQMFTAKGTFNLGTKELTRVGGQPSMLTLKLGPEDGSGLDLVDHESTSEDYGKYSSVYKRGANYLMVAYMEMYPVSITLEAMKLPTLYLIGHRGTGADKVRTVYKATLTKKNIRAGYVYQWTCAPDDEEPISFEEITVQQWEDEVGYNNGETGKGTANW